MDLSFLSLVLLVVGLYIVYMILGQVKYAMKYAKYFMFVGSPVLLVELIRAFV